MDDVRALHAAGRFEESLDPLVEMIDAGTEDPEVFYRYGVALAATRRPSQALWPLRRAMESEDWRLPAALSLAAGGLETGNFEEAIKAASIAIELEPDHLRALRVRAMARIQSRKDSDYELAIEDAEHVLDLDPGNPDALIARATALLALERTEEAEEALAEVIEAASGSTFDERDRARFCAARAVFAKEKEKLEEAEAIHRECLENHPTSPTVVRSAMDYFLAQGKPEEATAVVLAAHRADPTHREFRVGYAVRQQAEGDIEGAEQTLREATQLEEPLLAAEAWRDLGGFLADQRRFDDAVAAYEEAVAIVPNPSTELLFSFADTLLLAEQFDRALEVASRVGSVSHRALIEGRVHLAQHRPDKALERFSEGLRLWPDNAIGRYYAAVAAEQSGAFDRAIEEYRYSLRVDPSATDGRFRLARILAAQGDEEMALSALHHSVGRAPATLDMALLELELTARRQPVAGKLPPRLLSLVNHPSSWGRAVAAIAAGAWDRAGPTAAVRVIESGSRLDLADPMNQEALRLLIHALISAGRADEALTRLEKLAREENEKAQDNALLHALLGRVHARTGEEGEARQAYEAALSLDSEQPEALAGLAALTADEDPQAALEIYSRGLENRNALGEPARGALARARAALLARLDRTDEAVAQLEARLLAEPLDVETAAQLAQILKRRGDEAARTRAEDLAERSRRFERARSRFSFDSPAGGSHSAGPGPPGPMHPTA